MVGGNGSTLTGGAGVDYLKNYGSQSTIDGGGANADVIFNGDTTLEIVSEAFESEETLSLSGNESKIYGGDGDDTVSNESSGVKIYGQNGADSINNSGSNEIYISLGDGVDSVWNTGEDVLILGGNGADVLTNQGNGVIIRGDAGKDSITNTGKHIVYQFGAGDGKDTVVGFNDGDTVQITGGTYTSKTSGKSVIVSVGNDRLTLNNASDKVINFVTSSDATIASNSLAKDVRGGTGDDYLRQ